jgi:hypothetical protein
MTKAAVKEKDTTLFGEVEAPEKRTVIREGSVKKNLNPPPTSPRPPAPKSQVAPKPKATAKKNEVAIRAPANTETTPMELLKQAIAGGNVEIAEKMMGLQERWEKNNARKAFDAAMADAKAKIPVINKNRKVDFTSAKGRTHYKHEDMAEIARTVDPLLTDQGLSYRYRTSIEGANVTVTCIISHRLGHSEETTLSAGRDETGNKNSIQAVGSTVTYLQRYTLKAALGLAASDDDDGKSAGKTATKTDAVDDKPITPDQAKTLIELVDTSGVGGKRFCEKYGLEKVGDLPEKSLAEATKALENYVANNKAK